MMPVRAFQPGTTHPQLAGQVAGAPGTQLAGQVPGFFHPFPYPYYQPNLNGMFNIPVLYMPPGQPNLHHCTATATSGTDTAKPLTNGSVGSSNGVSNSAVFPSFNSKPKGLPSSGQSSTIPTVSDPSRQRVDYSTTRKSTHKSYHQRRDHDYKRVLADKWFALQRKRSEHFQQRNKQIPKKTLSIPFDPRRWTPKDVHTWLFYTIHMNDIEEVDFSYFVMNGKGLCLLSESAFVYRVPNPPSDPGGKILYRDLRLRLLRCIRAEKAHAKATPTPNLASNPRSLSTDHTSRLPAEHSSRIPVATQRPPQEYRPFVNHINSDADRSDRTPKGKHQPHSNFFIEQQRKVRSTTNSNSQQLVTSNRQTSGPSTDITGINHSFPRTVPMYPAPSSTSSLAKRAHFPTDPRQKLNILHTNLERNTEISGIVQNSPSRNSTPESRNAQKDILIEKPPISNSNDRISSSPASEISSIVHNSPSRDSNPDSSKTQNNILMEKSQISNTNHRTSSSPAPGHNHIQLKTEIPHSSSSPDPTPSSTKTDDQITEKVAIKPEPIDHDDHSHVQECSSCLVCTAEKESKLLEDEAFVNKIQSKYQSQTDGKNV